MIKSRCVDRAKGREGRPNNGLGRSNDLLAVRREQPCIGTSYDEFDSLSAIKPHHFNDTQQDLAPARLPERSRGFSWLASRCR
jgi:hypothetical protein